MTKNPEIRIYFAYWLANRESRSLAGTKTLMAFEWYEKRTKDYRKEWLKHQDQILGAMQKMLNLKFYKPVIDVACAPFFWSKSEPLIIDTSYPPDIFVDVLAHELTHVLLRDNNKFTESSVSPGSTLVKKWQILFGEHAFVSLIHIPVHAVAKAIYLDVLKQPQRLERDISNLKLVKAKDYISSWDYVENNDYKKIISDLRLSYEGLRK